MLQRMVMAFLFAAPIPAQQWARYRGPGDLLPPGQGGRADGIGVDLTVWQFAWEFQRDSLVPPLLPSAPGPQVTAAAVLALVEGCKVDDVQLQVLSMWGLARLAREDDAAAKALHEIVLGGALKQPAPLGEVAALALGLGARGDMAAVDALRQLANDTAKGRALVGAKAVPERTRCYALYGIGLAAEGHADPALQFRVLAAVERLLLPTADTAMPVRIAALHALLLVQLKAAPTLSGPALQMLDQQWGIEEPAGPWSIRAQVPLATAAMLKPEDKDAVAWRKRFADALTLDSTRNPVRRSCAQALGNLVGIGDAEAVDVLREVSKSSKDNQTQYLALFALGKLGGKEGTAWSLRELAARDFMAKPWLGLGIAAGYAARNEVAPPEVTIEIAKFASSPNPNLFAAFVTSQGLCQATDAAPRLRDALQQQARRGELAACYGTALGLLDYMDALPTLTKVAGAASSPLLCNEAMSAMARIDPAASHEVLCGWLLDAKETPLRRFAAATALRGQADEATVTALARTLSSASASLEDRQLAAFALGSIGDGSPRHWSARLAASIDYRSATPELVGLPFGVLRLP